MGDRPRAQTLQWLLGSVGKPASEIVPGIIAWLELRRRGRLLVFRQQGGVLHGDSLLRESGKPVIGRLGQSARGVDERFTFIWRVRKYAGRAKASVARWVDTCIAAALWCVMDGAYDLPVSLPQRPLPAGESAAMQATAGGIPEWCPVVVLLGCEQ